MAERPFFLETLPMMTTLRMSVEFSTDLRLSKMKRGSYAEWKRNEEEARKRSEQLKKMR